MSTKAPETNEICTQTTETAFMLCAQCSITQAALVDSADLISGLCKASNLRSMFAIYDWNTLVKRGGIEIIKWCDSLKVDTSALKGNIIALVDKLEVLTSDKEKLKNQVAHLKEKNQSLDNHLNAVKVSKIALLQ